MAISQLQIKNMALDELPAQRIATEDEVSLEAETTAQAYQPALDFLLEEYDWDFAIRRATLAQVTNARANEWAFAYALPSDMARPRLVLPYPADTVASGAPGYSVAGQLRGFESIVPYRIADGKLYAGREKAVLEYITNAPAVSSFPAKFARALALEIAVRSIMPIKKDRARQGDLIKAAEVARERAKAEAMNRDREGIRDFVSDTQLARDGLIPWL